MRSFSTILAVASFATSTLALPGKGWGGWPFPAPGPCLTDAQANSIVSQYAYLLINPQGANFVSTAQSLLSDSFFVSSDSIDSLAGIPLGVNPYPSKQAFIGGQASTPPIPVLVTLGTFHTCDQIAWRWNASSIGSNKDEVKGIITMDVNATTLQINAVYSEFNTAAWLADIGNPECPK